MRQPGSPRSQSRSKANGSWQDAYWWQRHGHHEIFDVIHEIVLPAEFDKPDDQAKKDVSIVDGKHGSGNTTTRTWLPGAERGIIGRRRRAR
jgi:hypothetical protein